MSTGCSWTVHARVLPSNRILCVRRFDSLHTCGVAVRTYRNLRTGSELVSDVIADSVCNQLLTRPTDVVFDMKNDYGLDISYRVAWLGMEKARGIVYGDHAMSFDQLIWYSDAVMEKNPNSYINLEFDQKSARFGRFKGNLLAATAKDGNQGLFFIAFVIVDSENTANWEWFLQQLTHVVDSSRNLTFVSDRNAGLLQSMPIIFPSAHHAFYKYKASYSGAVFPIPTAGKPTFKPDDYLIAPPIVKHPPGRPKRKRIPSKGEVIQRIRCGRCGKMGNHNRKTYKEPM
ncbi:hypothetical protein ACSBR2_008989 [Camellia fascicularis]